MDSAPAPLLHRVPDGRRAPVRAFEEVTPLYVALMLGVPAATLTVAWNLLAVRRWGYAAGAVLLGLVGSVGCTAVLVVALGAGPSSSVAVLGSQLAGVAVGAALYSLQRPIVRGHRLLGGTFVPTTPLVFGALALQLAFRPAVFALMHPLLALMPSGSP